MEGGSLFALVHNATYRPSLAFAKRVVEQVRAHDSVVNDSDSRVVVFRDKVARGLIYLHLSEVAENDDNSDLLFSRCFNAFSIFEP